MTHLVFVYGTLKCGFPNHPAYMHSSEFLGTCTTVEKYPLVLSGHRYVPCMLDRPGEGAVVVGELFRVNDESLRHLDALEEIGRSHGYLRRIIEVCMAGEPEPRRLKAFAYLMPPEKVSDVRSEMLSEYRIEDARKYSRKGE